MMKSQAKILMILVFLTGVILVSTTASAQIAPYLTFGGNYQYDSSTKMLTFTDNYADWLDYTNGDYDCLYPDMGCVGGVDPILNAALSFGPLTNSDSNPLVFSSSTFTVNGFFTATLDNFVVNNSELMWGNLSNIQRLDGGTSRYVNELLANGGGIGNISLSFTPTEGGANNDGVENFTITSYGSTGGVVAAPEPVSAILFVAGGVTLALRRYRKKRV